MNKNNLQTMLIFIIVISVIISGYILFGPKKNPDQTQNANPSTVNADGKQVLKMTVFADRYEPEYFTVKAGVPVQWEITSSGQPGCDSGAIITKGFGSGTIYLNPNQGQITNSEFVVQTPGTYKFACPMGMVRGTIEVIN